MLAISALQKTHAAQVESEHRIKCALATFTSHRQELSSPKEGQTQTLRSHTDPITLPRIRHVDDDGRNEEEAPDNATTDDEDDDTNTETSR